MVSPMYYHSDGSAYAQVSTKSAKLKIIVDTLRFDGDSLAVLSLNERVTTNKANVSPTSGDNITIISVTQDLSDATTSALYDYAFHSYRNGDLTIRSTGTTDSSLVWVSLMIR
ncbi:MAG: hypothetical protein U9N61_08120 [Euryarchaeota archaeon]|nr:hypothetical protein [Euryarchaeota archaeon]